MTIISKQILLFLIVCFVVVCKSHFDTKPRTIQLKEENPEGIWKSKMDWKAHWVKHWETRTIWVPVWRKVWGPIEIKEWVPFPKPSPTWIPPQR